MHNYDVNYRPEEQFFQPRTSGVKGKTTLDHAYGQQQWSTGATDFGSMGPDPNAQFVLNGGRTRRRRRRRGGALSRLQLLVASVLATRAASVSFSDFLNTRLSEEDIKKVSNTLIETAKDIHIPTPPNPLEVASTLLQQYGPSTGTTTPPSVPSRVASLPVVEPAPQFASVQSTPVTYDVSGLTVGERYLVFPIATGAPDDEEVISAFDALTPVYYIGDSEDGKSFRVKERQEDPEEMAYLIPKISFMLSAYKGVDGTMPSAWMGRARRRRRTLRRRKTFRRKD
jgi:hypothetical protein